MKHGETISIEMESTACPRCAKRAARPLLSGEDWLYGVPGQFHAVACAACDLWYQDPRPARASLSALYPSDYGPHAPRTQAQPAAAARLGFLQRVQRRLRGYIAPLAERQARETALTPELVRGGSILEIGCAAGQRLVTLREQGWQRIQGIEMVPAAAQRARELGFTVECGMVEDALARVPDASLDAVVSSMVLEHLYDPIAVIRRVAGKLKPGGQLLFSTIVRDSLDRRLFGRYWACFDFPRHMVYLSRADVRRALAEAGFAAPRIVDQSAPVDFVRAATWRAGIADRALAKLFASDAGDLLGVLLARLGLSSRISVYSRLHRAA
jgi:SAM-dependent methyltransferase